MSTHLKIGLIQSSPATADFPNNLRQIVQGYRECLDHGADLVVASAYALCGAEPKALASRASYLRQSEAALDNLSRELGDTPLILAAYTPVFEEDDEFVAQLVSSQVGVLTPMLLENGEITELSELDTVEINGCSVYVDFSSEVSPGHDTSKPEVEELDLLIHLSTAPWYAGAAAAEEDEYKWQAQDCGIPVICVHHVGTADGNIYAGGSAVYSPQGTTLARLPFFENCNRVVTLNARTQAKALPTEQELLCRALERGIRDTVRSNGYGGVSLNLDSPHADLLAAICTEALGRSNVVGITGNSESHIAKALRITCHPLPLAPLQAQAAECLGEASEELSSRISAVLQFTLAEKRGLMHLSALTRRDLMTGNFTLYGESCAHFAPFGNLYEMDLYLLRKYLHEKYADLFGPLKEPNSPETDRIIHELTDCNISATALLHERISPFSENDVRIIQRKIIASALKRTQTPMVLHADRPSERHTLPVAHRMND